MNQELKDVLRSVLKEELQPIYERLEFVEQTLKHLIQLTILLDRIIEHEKEILNLKTRLPN
ncbi:hypothetical protein JS44_10725 [Anoxybacillus flavithermus]|uniref:Uncharacterized protein n=1 Tax=Anoxybacillus flavithermus TaxID=33934 RepID=A0A094J2T6_9BACL|nr:hypothetical protein JS44_10725 [Anoxybacillus flavithermus]